MEERKRRKKCGGKKAEEMRLKKGSGRNKKAEEIRKGESEKRKYIYANSWKMEVKIREEVKEGGEGGYYLKGGEERSE